MYKTLLFYKHGHELKMSQKSFYNIFFGILLQHIKFYLAS
jgi:hypothetical protein